MKKSEVLKLSDSELDKTIKIQGTDNDRKRKVSIKDEDRIVKIYNSSFKTQAEIAEMFRVSQSTVSSILRGRVYKSHPGTHDHGYTDLYDRASYKRDLVETGKVKIAHIL